MHRYHPVVGDDVGYAIQLGHVPPGFTGDDPEAILFDDCDRCDEHTANPRDTMDRPSQARLLTRGIDVTLGKDTFRSTAERRAWNNILVEDESPTERTDI